MASDNQVIKAPPVVPVKLPSQLLHDHALRNARRRRGVAVAIDEAGSQLFVEDKIDNAVEALGEASRQRMRLCNKGFLQARRRLPCQLPWLLSSTAITSVTPSACSSYNAKV